MPGRPGVWRPLNETAADVAPYRIVDRSEVIGVLRDVHDRRRQVTVYFNSGTEYFQSRLLAVNPQFEELIFDIGTDTRFNEHFALSTAITFVTSDQDIRVQFSSAGVELVMLDELPAFRVRVPASIVRLQRRNFYRIATPVANPLLIRIPEASGMSGFSGRVSCKVLDISCGGASVLVPDDRLSPRVGDWYDDCVLDLGAEGEISPALEVRHVSEERVQGRVRGVRLRCRFRGLGEAGELAVQRYIRRLEVERRERL